MKKFVSDLQVNFPATVNTILKTGDKLSLESTNKIACKLCKVIHFMIVSSYCLIFYTSFQGLLPEASTHLSSEESTNFSRLASTELVDDKVSQQKRCLTLIDKFQKLQSDDREYCYACNKIILNS